MNPYLLVGWDHPWNLGIRAGFEPGLLHLSKILNLSSSLFPHLDSSDAEYLPCSITVRIKRGDVCKVLSQRARTQ